VTDRPEQKITLTNMGVKEGSRGRYQVYGDAVNNCDTEVSAILGVTFYDAEGTVMGKASGSVNRLAACQVKPFWMRVSNDVSGYASMEVEVDCIL
jgi:hypothetical protein